MNVLTPRGFLVVGGAVLVMLGLVGLTGILSEQSFPQFYLDPGENVAHLALGIVALAAVYVPGLNDALRPYYTPIVALVGLIALFFGLYGFVVADNPAPNTFGISNLESPLDNLLHLVVAAWALAAAWRGRQSAMA